MTAAPATTTVTTQVYRVYIKATPQAVWDAITKPEWTERYGYGGVVSYELRPGGKFITTPGAAMRAYPGIPDVIIDGEVIEAAPPHKLVQTWRMLMDPEMAAEGFTRLTHEIEQIAGGATKLSVIHELEGAPKLAVVVGGGMESEGAGGGWAWVLSDLKSLLETGSILAS
ncbi:MAG TPA: SRPBCC family protein [Chloroflexota bacterium]|nr:SRPBCC family protein [Chloroflexota bacterium]